MVIAEFPSVRIDDFRLKLGEEPPEIGFLTHMHEDHTSGLSRKSYYGPVIYCTAATRALLLNFRTKNGAGEVKYGHLQKKQGGKDILKQLNIGEPYVFVLKKQKIEVTLIDANHCPGAAMVLIKEFDTSNAILFTGDLRCERWHLNCISRTPSLLPFLVALGGNSTIALYVDDTFSLHVDPFKSYPENRKGTMNLASLLKQYPPEVHFCLADNVTGYEEFMITLAQLLQTKVHISQYIYDLYLAASDTSPLARKLLEYTVCGSLSIMAYDSVRLHFCQKNSNCALRYPHSPMAYMKPCNQPNSTVLAAQNRSIKYNEVKPESMIQFVEDLRVYKGPTQRYYLDKKSKTFFPLFPWFHFSRHASFPELKELVQLFKTTSVKSIRGYPLKHFGPNSCKEKEVPVIPVLGDRMKILGQKRIGREAVYDLVSSDSLNADDEPERHAAMALLCHPKRVLSDVSQSPRKIIKLNKEPLLSPLSTEPTTSVEIDETSDDSTAELIRILRENPVAWFELSLECREYQELI